MKAFNGIKQFINSKTYNIITLVILIIVFVVSSFFVGFSSGMHVINILLINAGVLCFSTLYFILKKIFSNNFKIIKNKLDIFVLILCISPIIPIVFNSCISLSEAVITLFKFIVLYNIYLLVREIISEKEKHIQIFMCVFIIVGLLLCFLGFDDLLEQKLTLWISELLHFTNVENTLDRMRSILFYPNSFAIYIVASLLMTINLFLNTKSIKIKLIYMSIAFVFIACIILSKSIGALCVLCFIALLQFIFSNKEKRYEMVEVYFINIIFGLIFSQLFIAITNLLSCLVLLIVFAIIVTIIQYFLFKVVNPKIYTFNIKKVIIIGGIILIITILFIVMGLLLTKPLMIFDKNSLDDQYIYVFTNFKPDTDYNFVFDIDAQALAKDNYKIVAQERVKHNIVFKEYEVLVCDNYKDKVEFNIHISKETKQFQFVFTSNNVENQNGFIVNSIMANNENLPLDYVYLPFSLINKIKLMLNNGLESTNLNYRLVFINDVIKIIKDNWLTGIGGNSWQYKYHDVQDFKYYTTDVHNYYLQTFAELGIVALLSIILIAYAVIEFYIKNRKNMSYIYYIVLLALLAFMLHSAFDTTMSYYFIMMYVFAFLGIISAKIGKKIDNKLDILLLIMLLLINGLICSSQIVKASIVNTRMDLKISIDHLVDFLPYDDLTREIYLNNLSYKIGKTDKKYSIKYYQEYKKNFMMLYNNEKYFLTSNALTEFIKLNLYYRQSITKAEEDENFKYVYNYIDYHIKDYNYDINTRINKFIKLYEVINMLNKYYNLLTAEEKVIYNNCIALFTNNYDNMINDIENNELLLLDPNKRANFLDIMQQLNMNFKYITETRED